MIRKRRDGLQVQVYAGRDPLYGRKRYVSQQVAGQTKASMRQAKQMTLEVQRRAARILQEGIAASEVRRFIDAAHRAHETGCRVAL